MANEQHVGTRNLGQTAWAGVFMTLLLHAAIGYAIYQAHIAPEPPAIEFRDVIVTQTIALGKQREKFWLPRIVNAPRPKVEPPVIKVADDPNAPPEPPKEPPKLEDKDINKNLRSALQRARSLAQANVPEEEPEGSPTGSATSTSTQSTTGDEYASKIFEAIRANWNAATLIDEATLNTLRASVRVRIDADGTLLEPSLTKKSGNDIFDDSCLQAVKSTGRVPPPPPAEAAKYKRGISLMFDPKGLGG